MDGAAIKDDKPIRLVATTSRGSKVIANVTRNLEQMTEHGWKGCGILVATPAKLSARQCQNINNRITMLGFVPAHPHVYTRDAIAQRLYGNSRVRIALLGLTGEPPCISKLPYHSRPLDDIPLIGREQDLEWLQATEGNRLITGQPGIGKTFLLRKYCESQGVYFVHNASSGQIADSVRDNKPQCLIIEDSHNRIELLYLLLQLQAESGIPFSIVADAWPNRAEEMMAHLGITRTKWLQLKKLNGKQIVEVLTNSGISGPRRLLHQLVHQSDGCPGRSAMLADLCLRENVTEVWDGSALASWTRKTFYSAVGEQAFRMLGVISLSGSTGLDINNLTLVQNSDP